MKLTKGVSALIVTFGFSLLFSNCQSPKRLAKKNANYDLSFERTPCYGKCPKYKLLISKTGLMTYEGIMFTEKTGQWQKRISPKELNGIYQKFDRADLAQYADEYPSGHTDMASKIISFKKGQTLKTIRMEGEHPQPLKHLSAYLDSIANSPQWIDVNLK
jgi:hypothetical protein